MRRLEITATARRDIDVILETSGSRHGAGAASRYRRLIGLAFSELRRDPRRLGSQDPRIADLRLYALRHPARRLPPAQAVRAPPHVVVYRHDLERVEIIRLLHQAMDLPRRLQAIEGGGDDA